MFHTLYLETTRRCNFRCEYCSSGSNQPNKWENDKSADDIIRYILEPAKDVGTTFIDFSGGEFFLRKDALLLLETAHRMGFKIGISTNGSLLTEELVIQLKHLLDNNLLISLGINSFDEENKATRYREIELFLEKLDLLQKYNINVNISVTMGRFNCETFNNTIAKIRSMSLPFNRIPFTPRNSPHKELMFDKEILKNYLHPALMKSHHGFVSFVPFFLNPNDYEALTGEKAFQHPVPAHPSIGCWVGSFYAVNPAGDVAPCPLLSDNMSAGNVYTRPLKEILYESDLMKKIVHRPSLGGKCGTCKYNWTCGGCRVMAYYHTGDVFGEDPTCFIDEISPEELEKFEKQTRKHFRNYVRMDELSRSIIRQKAE
ncbi:MAG TPA: radical SAM protein [Bacteroidales bacterium]|nr:radical SAM protein [Bacteroidales bacterium]